MSLLRILFTVFISGIFSLNVAAQSLLNRTVTLDAKQRPLSEVLNIISKQGNFYFSYISNILPQDSIVSISVRKKTVRQVLDLLFAGDYMYKESGNYIILLKKSSGQTYYLISGTVSDRKTGMRVANASVYERQQLISTLTNNDGYFRLRLRDKYPTAAISVSKDLYLDTSLVLNPVQDQEVVLSITPVSYQLKTVEITSRHQVEKTWFGRALLSSRQKMQSLNLASFFADKPYQMSLTPGLGTHGRMGAQVVNKLSFNLLGGYTAGVDGVEIGSAFNIVKHDMQHVQLAGVLNVVGGKTKGVQVAGVHNNVLDSLKGVQIAGVSNNVEGSQLGVQMAGVWNHIHGNAEGLQAQGVAGLVSGDMDGWQVSGIGSIAEKNMRGLQVAGIFNEAKDSAHGAQLTAVGNFGGEVEGFQGAGVLNVARKSLDGVQIAAGLNVNKKHTDGFQGSGIFNYTAGDLDGGQVTLGGNIVKRKVSGFQLGGLFNYAHHLKGVQIGIVNIADTSEGYSVGLINIVRRGFKRVSVYSNDLQPVNIAWKTGRERLYSILLVGYDPSSLNTSYSIGYGIGTEIPIRKRLFIAAEFTSESLYQRAWDGSSTVLRVHPLLHYRLGRKISIFAGPSFVVQVHDMLKPKEGYHVNPPGSNYPSFNIGKEATGWLGWQAGISIF
ncbi:MAG TPA: STN and carboxypeptidase regulatory-like domain-containing protein [Chitinophaga sp.]|uniref:STN and carboxypeptidase regulatory-like domain-containing protein n=1 Tax=Chitinophaga sp. TaxID=1869181 RepID=UPI002BA7D35B|nr:STN and carboxypeptidase regulatory-like domain-containing protein [Chitinophaga sp.]HVI48841.1 STN and carboxypeptidase regulatory-like domain-containing protein [Chitinophaga sp.]